MTIFVGRRRRRRLRFAGDVVEVGRDSPTDQRAPVLMCLVQSDIRRFASRAHFASWNGTAPLDASSGHQNRHRLSRAGNRRINRALHIMAVVQLRHDTDGRRHFRRKVAAGKTPMEAMRALQRRLSDVVYKQMLADAIRLGTGPGGHVGATLTSSAADLNPMIDTFGQVISGPAEPHLKTTLMITT